MWLFKMFKEYYCLIRCIMLLNNNYELWFLRCFIREDTHSRNMEGWGCHIPLLAFFFIFIIFHLHKKNCIFCNTNSIILIFYPCYIRWNVGWITHPQVCDKSKIYTSSLSKKVSTPLTHITLLNFVIVLSNTGNIRLLRFT